MALYSDRHSVFRNNDALQLPPDAKQRLLALTPASYTGLAEILARMV